MKKFECNNCTNQHCYAENIQGEKPSQCLSNADWDADWQEVDNSESLPKLPKLTVEALKERGIKWPDWAKCAVTGPGPIALFLGGYPTRAYVPGIGEFWEFEHNTGSQYIPGQWDASYWQNSLIERPAVVKENLTTELPEWCKFWEWCVYTPTGRFYKIESIDSVRRRIRTTDPTKENSGWESTFESFLGDYRPARVRPWTFKEAPLASKIVFRGNWGIATLYYHCNERKFGYNINHRDICAFVAPEDMVRDFTLLDGSPCGVLEVAE